MFVVSGVFVVETIAVDDGLELDDEVELDDADGCSVVDDAVAVDDGVGGGFELDDANGWSVVDAGAGSVVVVVLLSSIVSLLVTLSASMSVVGMMMLVVVVTVPVAGVVCARCVAGSSVSLAGDVKPVVDDVAVIDETLVDGVVAEPLEVEGEALVAEVAFPFVMADVVAMVMRLPLLPVTVDAFVVVVAAPLLVAAVVETFAADVTFPVVLGAAVVWTDTELLPMEAVSVDAFANGVVAFEKLVVAVAAPLLAAVVETFAADVAFPVGAAVVWTDIGLLPIEAVSVDAFANSVVAFETLVSVGELTDVAVIELFAVFAV